MLFADNVLAQSTEEIIKTLKQQNYKDSVDLYDKESKIREGIVEKTPFNYSEVIRTLHSINDNNKEIISLLENEIKKLNDKSLSDRELEIYNFLNREDNTIFDRKIFEYKLSEIPLSCQPKYLLVKPIVILDTLLLNIEKNIELKEEIINLLESTKGIEALLLLAQQVDPLKESIEQELSQARDLILEIDKKDKTGFTQEQLQYYRPSLVEKYNAFIDKIYPE
jgi:hypothetical protein